MTRLPLITMLAAAAVCPQAAKTDDAAGWEAGFRNPPVENRIWTYWMRMNGLLTKEGLTADLEAMKSGGMGGAWMFDVSGKYNFRGPVDYMSPEWFDLLKHTVAEARRLGLKLGMHNTAGWSSSGGPWVPAEDAMQIVVTSEKHAQGPAKFEEVLPQPLKVAGYYKDTTVVAFPLLADTDDIRDLSPRITSTAPKFDPAILLDGRNETVAEFPIPTPESPQYVQIEFAKPFTARTLVLDPGQTHKGVHGELQASEDGKKYRVVRPFWIRHARGKRSFSFPAVSARYYRIVWLKPDRAYYEKIVMADMDLSGELRLDDYEAKAGFQPYPKKTADIEQVVAPGETIPAAKVIDLTSKLQPGGRLVWDVPEGKWVILRLGHTPLPGDPNTNNPAPPGGRGFEVDKLDAAAVRRCWDGGMGRVIKELGPLAGTVLTEVTVDSYERGQQNWTGKFPQEFEKRRGYRMTPFLPVLTGRVVGSLDESERFLADYCRTMADLFIENYAGTMARLAHENKMTFSVEPAGFINEQIAYLGQADSPTNVTWVAQSVPNNYLPSMAAHVYGRRIVNCEVMTAKPEDSSWRLDPYALKALGDASYTAGTNRFVMHVWAHQPWAKAMPGMTAGPWGTHFDRGNTWWKPADAWREYLARCQSLLQRGVWQADGLFFCGEEVPVGAPMRGGNKPGYAFDGCNADVILNRLTVKDGKLMLPNGAAYSFLSMNGVERVSPEVMRKIRGLVEEGAVLLGDPPKGSPGLGGYPGAEQETLAIAEELWGPADKAEAHRMVGRGHVFKGTDIAPILEAFKIRPDFEYAPAKINPALRFTHRRDGGADIYFVSNQADEYVRIDGVFRLSGKIPELWHADSGEIERSPLYREEDGRTVVPLALAPRGSIFVVFRKPSDGAKHLVAVKSASDAKPGAKPVYSVVSTASGQAMIESEVNASYDVEWNDGKKETVSVSGVPKPLSLPGPWTLRFPPDLGAPAEITLDKLISWTEHSENGVRYFSGTATYTREIDLPREFFAPSRSLFIDLGEVRNLARVKVNDSDAGVAWKVPYRIEITKYARPGKNTLEIELTNLWPNRLIGDEQLPPDCEWMPDGSLKELPEWFLAGGKSPSGRIAFTTWRHWQKDDKLLPSGLLGPVRILSAQTIPIP